MKRIIFLITLITVLTNCKEGLDPEIYGSLNPAVFPSTEKEFELYALNVYVPFSCKWPYEEGGVTKFHFFGLEEGHIQMFDAPTDIMPIFTAWGNGGVLWDFKSRGNFRPMIAQGRDRAHFEKVRLITKNTKAIGDLEKATVFQNENFRKQLIAEVKMARGFTMDFLLQMYGPVPVILDPAMVGNKTAESNMQRPSRDEFNTAIVNDLRYAADNLPMSPADYGRFNKGFALTTLLRHYMNEKDFVKAEAVGREIKALGYGLVNDYASLFKEATERNSETIWAVSAQAASQGRGADGSFNAYRYYTVPNDFPSKPGWAGPDAVFMASWNFYDSFDPSDKRRALMIASYAATSGVRDRTNMMGAVINKYTPDGPNAYQGNDIVIARYADVMLLLAEAINENSNGPTQEAIDLVNAVRTRAGIGALSAPDAATKASFKDALLRERAWELYFEGWRFFDLKRHGKWPTALTGITGKEPGPAIFPIPQYAVDDGVAQNPEFE